MKKDDIKHIKQLLSEPKSIVVVPHKNPDGDAIGSSLGIYHYLKQFEHKITIIAPNDYPDFLKWIPSEETVMIYDSQTEAANLLIEEADILFTLDFNALNRIGNMEAVVTNSKAIKIMIDHHQQPDGYALYTYSDVSMSSTCEMVYNFIVMLDDVDHINADVATCLYTGIMTDTGSFRFPSTTSQTHQVIAALIDKGANNAQIHNNIYDTNSYNQLQLLGCALRNLKVLPEYNTAYITLSQEELNTYNFKKGDTEGFVNYGLSLQGVVFAAIFIENQQEQIIKISFRSKSNFSVNEFARAHFEGGGHINAAGGKSDLSMEATIEKFMRILPSYKHVLNL
ncbi:bifunctional oligoribonuclease/PAP phosphatase NrnA [Geojedonia litorea]|uniref:Bifunctional oligoribonuclease/PAP phosphatase NrnA n=1 Tax=Geojedonia litorea TaxID=1268269 RepID=A0ABV9N9B0_9FLAO